MDFKEKIFAILDKKAESIVNEIRTKVSQNLLGECGDDCGCDCEDNSSGDDIEESISFSHRKYGKKYTKPSTARPQPKSDKEKEEINKAFDRLKPKPKNEGLEDEWLEDSEPLDEGGMKNILVVKQDIKILKDKLAKETDDKKKDSIRQQINSLRQQLPESVEDLTEEVDHTGKTCTKCKKGKYGETSIHDDWAGKLHCSNKKCNHEIKRWQPKKPTKSPQIKKESLEEEVDIFLDEETGEFFIELNELNEDSGMHQYKYEVRKEIHGHLGDGNLKKAHKTIQGQPRGVVPRAVKHHVNKAMEYHKQKNHDKVDHHMDHAYHHSEANLDESYDESYQADFIIEDAEGVILGERKIVIRVNSKGKRRRKVICGKGMVSKQVGGGVRCIRMTGAQRQKKRFAQRKRLRTLKRKGAGFQRRLNIKRQRALRRRKAMGLKPKRGKK